MNNYDVSIIFVNYKTKDLTINAINSVIEKTEGINYEIFVVDNASNDGSIEAIENQFPNINIIKSEINGGFGYANNLAIKQAKGKYIFCLNTDTLLVNNAIKIMFDFMEKEGNKNVGACGGQLFNIDSTKQYSYDEHLPSYHYFFVRHGIINTILRNIKKTKLFFYNKETKVMGIIGADIMFRKSVLEEVGLFDENIFMYGEETELNYRIIKANYDIYFIPDAQIIHYGEQSSTSSDFLGKLKIKGIFYMIDKHRILSINLLKFFYLYKYLIIYILTLDKKYLQTIKWALEYKKVNSCSP